MARDCPYGYRAATWGDTPPACLRCGRADCPCAGARDYVRAGGGCPNDYAVSDLRHARCYSCGHRGHLSCAQLQAEAPGRPSCSNCGEGGHDAQACPYEATQVRACWLSFRWWRWGSAMSHARVIRQGWKPGPAHACAGLSRPPRSLPQVMRNERLGGGRPPPQQHYGTYEQQQQRTYGGGGGGGGAYGGGYSAPNRHVRFSSYNAYGEIEQQHQQRYGSSSMAGSKRRHSEGDLPRYGGGGSGYSSGGRSRFNTGGGGSGSRYDRR